MKIFFRVFFSLSLLLSVYFTAPTLAQNAGTDDPALTGTGAVTPPNPAGTDREAGRDDSAPSNEDPRGYNLDDTGAVLPGNLPTFGLEDETSAVRAFERILLNYVINPIFLLSGGVAVIVILYSSFRIITSRAQEEALTAAKTTLIWAFVGLGLIILAYTIVANLARIIIDVL